MQHLGGCFPVKFGGRYADSRRIQIFRTCLGQQEQILPRGHRHVGLFAGRGLAAFHDAHRVEGAAGRRYLRAGCAVQVAGGFNDGQP